MERLNRQLFIKNGMIWYSIEPCFLDTFSVSLGFKFLFREWSHKISPESSAAPRPREARRACIRRHRECIIYFLTLHSVCKTLFDTTQRGRGRETFTAKTLAAKFELFSVYAYNTWIVSTGASALTADLVEHGHAWTAYEFSWKVMIF